MTAKFYRTSKLINSRVKENKRIRRGTMFIIHTEHQLLVASAFSKLSSVFNILVKLSYWIFWKEFGDCDATGVLLSNQGCYIK